MLIFIFTVGCNKNESINESINDFNKEEGITYIEDEKISIEIAKSFALKEISKYPGFVLKPDDIGIFYNSSYSINKLDKNHYSKWFLIQREGTEFKNKNTELVFLWDGITLENREPHNVKIEEIKIKGEDVFNQNRKRFHYNHWQTY
ncbi:hypothetical protein [Facklamia lactis]|uniref:hypothetical protein n=1 Tax=Facklamia lactis TaxID=2749967 RepID=UPI0018CFD999|nr:hypothetical protein [Facklamia lactis]